MLCTLTVTGLAALGFKSATTPWQVIPLQDYCFWESFFVLAVMLMASIPAGDLRAERPRRAARGMPCCSQHTSQRRSR